MDMKITSLKFSEDIEAITGWVQEQYDSIFAEYFKSIKHLSERMASKTVPVTDSELESILIDLPLNLFSVAEKINQMTLNYEVIKLKNKKALIDKVKSSKESTMTMKKDVAESEMLEEKVMELAYSCLLDRVQKEVSYSKELIMGAKKVWDSRRNSVNPVREVDPYKRNTPVY